MEGFTAAQARHHTGCTAHQLRYWDKIGLVKPSVQATGGRPGVRRLYSFRDLVALRLVCTLLEDGMSLQRVRRAFAYLRKKARLDEYLSEVKLVTDGNSIFQMFGDDGELMDLLKEGQMAFLLAIDDATKTEGGRNVGHLYDRRVFVEAVRRAESTLERELPAPSRERVWAAR